MPSPFSHRSVAPKRKRVTCIDVLEGRDLMSGISPISGGGPPIPVNPSPPIIANLAHGTLPPIGLPPTPPPPHPVS
jgi:hypothetical protein